MSRFFLVRWGVLGETGVASHSEKFRFARDDRAVCRTERGLEVVTIICELSDDASFSLARVGELVRPLSDNDQRIIERLERHRARASDTCQRLLDERQIDAVLVDVEHLFDGDSLYFYFLGTNDDRLQAVLDQLATAYEKRIGYRQFVDRLTNGCGPGCGTTASRCGTTACANCTSGQCRSG